MTNTGQETVIRAFYKLKKSLSKNTGCVYLFFNTVISLPKNCSTNSDAIKNVCPLGSNKVVW